MAKLRTFNKYLAHNQLRYDGASSHSWKSSPESKI